MTTPDSRPRSSEGKAPEKERRQLRSAAAHSVSSGRSSILLGLRRWAEELLVHEHLVVVLKTLHDVPELGDADLLLQERFDLTERLGAFIFELDQIEAERRVDNLADLAGGERVSHVGHRGHDLFPIHVALVAA